MKFSKNIYVFLAFSLFFGSIALKAKDVKTIEDIVDNVVEEAKKIWNGAGDMLKGLGQGFGLVTSDYYYNYRVFNDSHAPIFVAEQRLTEFLGAGFKGNIVRGNILGPTANVEYSKPLGSQAQLYITLYLCAGQKSAEEYYKTPRDYISKWSTIIGKDVPLSPAGEIAGQIGKALGYDKVEDVNHWLGKSFGSLLGSVIGSIVNVFTKMIPFAYKNELDKNSVLKKTIYPWQSNDDNVYYYRVFTDVVDQTPVVNGEFLSLKGTSSEFSGQFYNSSSQDVILTFSKDAIDYTVTLESGSFNTLESSTQINSIRPPDGQTRWLQFYKAKPVSDENSIVALPIASEGIAYMYDTSKPGDDPNYVVDGPVQYSYKIYDSAQAGVGVAVQGLSIGNFDQPASGKERDINPAQCHLWYTSAAQAKALEQQKQEDDQQTPDYSSEPFELPEQVWVTYKTEDYTYQQKTTPGTVLDFALLRPQIKEKLGFLYVVSLQTDDDTKAEQFLDRLNAGAIGQGVLFSEATIDENNILTNMTPNVSGIIDDTQGAGSSGINGVVLLADQFAPQGVGSGPYYYMIQPGDLRIDQFASVIWFDKQFYKDPKNPSVLRDDVMENLATTLPQWIDQYRTDKQGAQTALKNYLLQKVSQSLFEDPAASPENRVLTQQGKELLQSLISGPISLEKYPILRKSGTNYYVMGFGQQPAGWLGQAKD